MGQINRVDNEEEAMYVAEIWHDQDCEDPTSWGIIRAELPQNYHTWCDRCDYLYDEGIHDTNIAYRAIKANHRFVPRPQLIGLINNPGFINIEDDPDYVLERISSPQGRNPEWVLWVPDENWEEWRTHPDRDEYIKAVTEEWQLWANGETWGVTVYHSLYCRCCRRADQEVYDSCGGFIGDVAVDDYIFEVVADAPVYVKDPY